MLPLHWCLECIGSTRAYNGDLPHIIFCHRNTEGCHGKNLPDGPFKVLGHHFSGNLCAVLAVAGLQRENCAAGRVSRIGVLLSGLIAIAMDTTQFAEYREQSAVRAPDTEPPHSFALGADPAIAGQRPELGLTCIPLCIRSVGLHGQRYVSFRTVARVVSARHYRVIGHGSPRSSSLHRHHPDMRNRLCLLYVRGQAQGGH